MTNVQTAWWYQNHFLAGLTMCEPNQDGVIEWMGQDKNWTLLGWLMDGVYADKSVEERKSLCEQYLALN